jgi:hypothetical protein
MYSCSLIAMYALMGWEIYRKGPLLIRDYAKTALQA